MTPEDIALNELWQRIDEQHGVAELETYLRHGGDVNRVRETGGRSLLHRASEHMNLGLIEALAWAGADLNARDEGGWTSLHVAVDIDIDSVWQRFYSFSPRHLTFSTTRYLVDLGADLTLENQDGDAPRDLAAAYGSDVLLRFDELTSRPRKEWRESETLFFRSPEFVHDLIRALEKVGLEIRDVPDPGFDVAQLHCAWLETPVELRASYHWNPDGTAEELETLRLVFQGILRAEVDVGALFRRPLSRPLRAEVIRQLVEGGAGITGKRVPGGQSDDSKW